MRICCPTLLLVFTEVVTIDGGRFVLP